MPSHTGFADIISSFENRMLLRILEKAFPTHPEKRSAYLNTHIGPEENYLKCSLTRLKCNFDLFGGLYYNEL